MVMQVAHVVAQRERDVQVMKTIRSAVLVLTTLLSAVAIGCSSEPEVVVVEKEVIREVPVEVEVEKIVEVEVVKEVPVEVEKIVEVEKEVPVPAAASTPVARATATPALRATATPVSTATPALRATATPVSTATPAPTDVLLLAGHREKGNRYNDNVWQYSHLPALGFSEGIPITVTRYSTPSVSEYGGVVAARIPEGSGMSEIHSYVYSGGNAAVFVDTCDTDDAERLQADFRVTCAKMPSRDYRIQGSGEQFAPFWGGLTISLFDSIVRVQLLPGQSEFTCIEAWDEESGTFCSALYGSVGKGNVIFMISGLDPGCTYPRKCPNNILSDEYINHYDNKEAASRLLHWLVQTDTESRSQSSQLETKFEAASVLARFSTTSAVEGEERANAVGEIIAQYGSGSPDGSRVLDLLHTIAPELSIDERRRAAADLERISAGDEWGEGETAEGVFYLAALITGDEPNPGERIEAAHEMVALYEAGELDADRGLELMNTIAPDLSINERRQAAAALAKLSADDDWDHADRMTAASEVFRLVTGVPLDAGARLGAAVDLAGVGARIFDTEDSFDDREIESATKIIKQSLTGQLTTESLQRILGSGN